MRKSANVMFLNPPIVLTFTRQRWSSTNFCWCEYIIYALCLIHLLFFILKQHLCIGTAKTQPGFNFAFHCRVHMFYFLSYCENQFTLLLYVQLLLLQLSIKCKHIQIKTCKAISSIYFYCYLWVESYSHHQQVAMHYSDTQLDLIRIACKDVNYKYFIVPVFIFLL
jgi:hypothetical protein